MATKSTRWLRWKLTAATTTATAAAAAAATISQLKPPYFRLTYIGYTRFIEKTLFTICLCLSVCNEYTYTARKTYPFFRGFLCVCLRVRDLMCCDVFSPSVPLLIFDFSDVCFCLRCSPHEQNKEEKNTNRSASHKHSICKHESRRERNEMNWMELDGLI